MDKQSVTNALSGVLALQGVGAGSTFDAPASSCAFNSKGSGLIPGRVKRFPPH